MNSPSRTILSLIIYVLLLTSATVAAAAPPTQQGAPSILIHDLRLTTDPIPQLQMIELTDGGVGNTPLTELVLLLFHTETETILAADDISGFTTDADGIVQLEAESDFQSVVANAETEQLPVNGIALAVGSVNDFAIGTTLDRALLLDAIVFATNVGTMRSVTGDDQLQAQSLFALPSTGGTIPSAGGTIPSTGATIPAPAAAAVAASAEECGTATTFIHEVQGAGTSSEMNETVVTIEGIVVGDFQDTKNQLRGFFVQEEAADFDEDSATSEGIYVFDNGFRVDVTAGDLVRVRGQVYEYNTLTELRRIESVVVCSQGNPVEPVIVPFPLGSAAEMEWYEGMAIRLDGSLQVAQNYFLGRYGQITIVADGRAYQPTTLYPPDSAEAVAVAEANAARLLILDDGRDIRALGDNPNPVPYLGTPDTTIIRAGDVISNVVGVIDFGRIDSAPGSEVGLGYRLQPIAEPSFATLNPRNFTPPTVGGSVKVTGFNVLNYFNGNGSGGGFPTARGAKTAAEFERQRNKIIAALSAMKADVIGLMEIENDGYGSESALQDLVNGLNEAVAASGDETTVYTFVDPGLDRLGADEIAVGILYNTATVTPTGSAATLDSGAFDQELADFGRSRQPLAQTFADANGERFTVVVNHFKSKRPSGTPDEANMDVGNGTGAWNGRRTEAAQDLIGWLATDPTGSGDPDFLVLGDLNAYAKESPITTFEEAGYGNLISHFGGAEAYSYVYDGQLGYLDHAIASSTLLSQTTGAMDWHINADEAKVLDYDAAFNPPQYYAADPFRASDHDPVLVGLALGTGSSEEPGEGEPGEETPLVNEPFTYSVLPGESLSRIARRYSVTIAALAEANGLYSWSIIFSNQQLTVPPVAEEVQCVRTIYSEPGESFAGLAERFATDPVRLAIANGFDSISNTVDGEPICLPSIW